MSNDAKRTSELGVTTTLANTDRVVVLTNPSTSAQTQTITVNSFIQSAKSLIPFANASIAGTIKVGAGLSIAANGVLSAPITIPGPYANDSSANTAGVSVGGLYYNSDGSVKIRLT